MITTRSLFEKIDVSRLALGFSIDRVAELIGVTPMTYKQWRNYGVAPRADREPVLRSVMDKLALMVEVYSGSDD